MLFIAFVQPLVDGLLALILSYFELLKSKIAVAKSIGETDIDEWNLDCITKRDIRVSDEIIGILNNWNQDYLKTFDAKNDPDKGPSAEELAKIEEFKKKGWI